MGFVHPSQLPEPGDESPRSFFEIGCQSLMNSEAHFCSTIGGRYAFTVSGEGTWVLDFWTTTVERAPSEASDIALTLGPEEFKLLCTGELCVGDAHRNGRLSIAGDLRLLANLGAFFARGSDAT
ncbi:MAG: SCP2 sterol-binding domain-containing protein [Myxococcota bacterium]